jgi:hypothetical protein
MADFSASLLDTNNLPAVDYSGTQLIISDYSNYITNTEAGHTQNNFSDYRVIDILQPDGTTYSLSSIAGADQLILAPAGEALPLTDNAAYTKTDGYYRVTLYTVPTWNSTGDQPDISPTYWQVVTKTGLSLKYVYVVHFVQTPAIDQAFQDAVLCAIPDVSCNCNTGCNGVESEAMDKAMKLLMIQEGVCVLLDNQQYNQIVNLVNCGLALIA